MMKSGARDRKFYTSQMVGLIFFYLFGVMFLSRKYVGVAVIPATIRPPNVDTFKAMCGNGRPFRSAGGHVSRESKRGIGRIARKYNSTIFELPAVASR